MSKRRDIEKLIKEFDEVWYKRWGRVYEPGPTDRRFEIKVEEVKAEGALLEKGAPKTCEAFWKTLPIEGYIIHAAWSGDMVRVLGAVELPVMDLENVMRYCFPGGVTFDPDEKELAIAYGVHEFRMPSGSHRLTVFAKITKNLSDLTRKFTRTRIEGIKPITIRRA